MSSVRTRPITDMRNKGRFDFGERVVCTTKRQLMDLEYGAVYTISNMFIREEWKPIGTIREVYLQFYETGLSAWNSTHFGKMEVKVTLPEDLFTL